MTVSHFSCLGKHVESIAPCWKDVDELNGVNVVTLDVV